MVLTRQVNIDSVSFDTDGSSAVAVQEVQGNGTASRPAGDSTKAGYTFENWFGDDAFATVWDFDTPITQEITLYAKWTADSHTLGFDSNGGSGTMSSLPLHTDEEATLSENTFTQTGYAFAGWATSSTGSVEYDDKATYTMGTADGTLYAKWEANTYTVIFDAQQGSTPTPSNKSVTYGKTFGTLPTTTRTSMRQRRW